MASLSSLLLVVLIAFPCLILAQTGNATVPAPGHHFMVNFFNGTDTCNESLSNFHIANQTSPMPDFCQALGGPFGYVQCEGLELVTYLCSTNCSQDMSGCANRTVIPDGTCLTLSSLNFGPLQLTGSAELFCNFSDPNQGGNGTWPNGTMPNGTWPNGTMPNGTWPNGTMPNGTWPNGTMPNGTMPNGTMPSPSGNETSPSAPTPFMPPASSKPFLLDVYVNQFTCNASAAVQVIPNYTSPVPTACVNNTMLFQCEGNDIVTYWCQSCNGSLVGCVNASRTVLPEGQCYSPVHYYYEPLNITVDGSASFHCNYVYVAPVPTPTGNGSSPSSSNSTGSTPSGSSPTSSSSSSPSPSGSTPSASSSTNAPTTSTKAPPSSTKTPTASKVPTPAAASSTSVAFALLVVAVFAVVY